jgi:hypothetical protein
MMMTHRPIFNELINLSPESITGTYVNKRRIQKNLKTEHNVFLPNVIVTNNLFNFLYKIYSSATASNVIFPKSLAATKFALAHFLLMLTVIVPSL